MRRPRTVALVAVAGVLLATAIGGWWGTRRSAAPTRAPAPASSPVADATRRVALTDLQNRLLPASEGGWVVTSPSEPVLGSWLLAAAESSDGTAFDAALAEAEPALRRAGDDRSLALVLAQVLPGPGSDRVRADRVAAEVLRRSVERLDAGDASWLGPLLQLTAGSSPSAAPAQAHLADLAGQVSCDRLPDVGQPVPAPSGSLTVILRVLSARAGPCPRAAAVLEAALGDPAWRNWIATSELADLAVIARPLAPRTRTRLARRLDDFLAVGPAATFDLGAVRAVQSARRRLGLDTRLDPPLAHHLRGQAAHRGGLAGRSDSPPTPLDVAVLRQLVAEGMAPADQLAATRSASRWIDEAGPVAPEVDDLLMGDDRFGCDHVPHPAPSGAKVTITGLMAAEIGAVVSRHCADDLDLAAHLRHLRAGGPTVERSVRFAAAVLTACRLDPHLLDGAREARFTVEGPFATDSVVVWARAIAADPAAACAAVTP
ncbi:MAG: hypothetical protein JWO77_1885 [Ilumatobacteraceae bacterium]|nr:hypothetical protein [Ilumatobacteraceae bacterium]